MDNNSTTRQTQTDLSFLDDKQSISFHIKDLVFLLLRNLHWLLLFAVLGGLIANFYARRQEKTYESTAKILIRSGNDIGVSDNDTREATIRSALGLRSFYSSTINNEIMILTSKSTIQKAVEDLHLNITYSTKTRIIHREKDLYNTSPVESSTARARIRQFSVFSCSDSHVSVLYLPQAFTRPIRCDAYQLTRPCTMIRFWNTSMTGS